MLVSLHACSDVVQLAGVNQAAFLCGQGRQCLQFRPPQVADQPDPFQVSLAVPFHPPHVLLHRCTEFLFAAILAWLGNDLAGAIRGWIS